MYSARKTGVVLGLSLGLVVSLVTGCDLGGEPSSGGREGRAACEPDELLAAAELRRDVGYLSSPRLAGRFPGTEGDRAAREYVEERFRCLGLEPGGEGGSYQRPFVTSEGDPTANVIGILPGTDPEFASETIVVGAHHDHIGERRGRIFPGANDNASGTAALMAVAAAVRERDPAPGRTIVFVAFGGEETVTSPPYLEGSARFVRGPPPGVSIDDVAYMVNLDMLGTYSPSRGARAYGADGETPAGSLIRDLRADHSDLKVRAGGWPGSGDSDFYPFHRIGIPYAYVHTPDPRCLHETCDRAGRLDYRSMASLTELTTELVTGLSSDSASVGP